MNCNFSRKVALILKVLTNYFRHRGLTSFPQAPFLVQSWGKGSRWNTATAICSLVPLFPRSLVPSFPCSLVPLFPRSLVFEKVTRSHTIRLKNGRDLVSKTTQAGTRSRPKPQKMRSNRIPFVRKTDDIASLFWLVMYRIASHLSPPPPPANSLNQKASKPLRTLCASTEPPRKS
jgi:hypothetical protein